MVRLRRKVFPYLVAVAPLIFGLLMVMAALIFGGSPTQAHTFPLPQPDPAPATVGP